MQKNPPKLDQKDFHLLYLLDLDARTTLASLAKNLRMSKEGVAYRLRKLENEGVIRSYNAVIDISALGYIGARFMIKFQHCNQKKEMEIIEYFNGKKNAWWVDSRGGEYDLGLAFWVKDVHELYYLREEFLQKYRPYILDAAPGIYHRMYQYPRAYLHKGAAKERQKPIILWDGKARKKHDRIDISILRLISTNARMPTVEMAKRLNLTPTIVNYRIKKLEKEKVILGYKPMLDLQKLGLYWYKIDFYLRDFAKRGELLKFASSHPNVVYTYDLISSADLEIEVEVGGVSQLLSIINEIREKFSSEIINYEYYLFSKEHKFAYVP